MQRILAFAVVLAIAAVGHATPVTAVTLAALSPRDSTARPAAARVITDLRLRRAAGDRHSGADLTVTIATQGRRRAPSYFEEHAARVDRAFLSFHHGNALEDLRQRDQLRLYGPALGGVGAAGNGIAIFSSTILATAHAPRPLRVLFDRRFHFGPAIFDQGGLGAGFGGAL